MKKSDFREPKMEDLEEGLAVWLEGRSFEDTNPIRTNPNNDSGPVCGPFLVERILFPGNTEPRVDLLEVTTGRRRSMMSSWLLVPKEEK